MAFVMQTTAYLLDGCLLERLDGFKFYAVARILDDEFQPSLPPIIRPDPLWDGDLASFRQSCRIHGTPSGKIEVRS
jgi:hypothetical protein